ncbi:MAG: M20/M25/M40 family metallo-hydrolase [Gammaproteobacteria bacterium]|nr:M20/M25/M40 family metallo-hydrolase [Gammaproteobacteria bacterium]
MTIKKILSGLAVSLLILVAVVLVRTLMFSPVERPVESFESVEVDAERVSTHLSQAVQFQTISHQNPELRDDAQFQGFIDWMAQTYPEVHQQLTLTKFNDYTLLYQWQGSDPELEPILLSGHYDVVPVLPGTESDWQHPPFAGVVADDYIWGRGALDDKSAVIGLMEAVTLLIKQGHAPMRTILIAATHDEEVGSDHGASAIVDWLKAQNIRPLWSLDEGSFVLNGLIPGVSEPVASINVAEKGYLNLRLSVESEGGHSSMPKGYTAVGVLARAIDRLQSHPIPSGMAGVSGDMFDHLAPHMPFLHRMLFANKWLFAPLIDQQLSESAAGNAMMRTTIAPTMFSGSVKANILPIHATAVVNFRLHPKDTIESVVGHVQHVINDERVNIEVMRGDNASNVSNAKGVGFERIASVSQHVHGPVVVTPGLTIAATDSRRYQNVVQDSYRFNPMSIHKEDAAGFHGTNERLSIDNMVKATEFYFLLIQTAQ